MTEEISNLDLFKKFGMNANVAKKMVKNEVKSNLLRKILLESEIDYSSDIDKKLGNVIVNLGTHKKIDQLKPEQVKIITTCIVELKIAKNNQVDEAVKYFVALKDNDFSKDEFERSCGIGIVLTKDDILKYVDEYFLEITDEEILATLILGVFIKGVKEKFPILKWGDGRIIKDIITEKCVSKLKLSTYNELKTLQKKLAKQNSILLSLRFRARELEISKNDDPKVLDEHSKFTKGKIVTRFPPEPNGYLHIGHAKSMLFNFGFAEQKNGLCNLRFDDTNPEKENKIYADGILEVVDWLGYKPAKICYSSDYFDQLYEFAKTLIRKDLAYMDFSAQKEISNQRLNRLESPYREKHSVDENLKIFEDMKHGKYEEGEVCYRLKIDYKSDNPNMRDFVGYRLKYHAHARTGNTWCVYPTYEFTHCLSDSIEHVTHSMCTMEFESKREPYYWLLDKLNLYKPFVWEFSRLNVTTSELSKRKINTLITHGKVKGFDDPRLLTIFGLRRRGYTPEIIKSFCAGLGAARTSDTYVDINKLEHSARFFLNNTCHRRFCVIKPLRVVIKNMKEGEIKYVKAKNHPVNKNFGEREMPISRIVYIEKDDFRLLDNDNYFGLAPDKWVGLRYGPNIKCEKVVFKDNNNSEILELECVADWEKKEIVKGHLHWVSESKPGEEPCVIETRFFGHLLKVRTLEKGMELLDVLNTESEKVIEKCYVEKFVVDELMKKKAGRGEDGILDVRYQFERVGFFNVDSDTNIFEEEEEEEETEGEDGSKKKKEKKVKKKIVMNLIVDLKESKDKQNLNGKGKKGGKGKGKNKGKKGKKK